MTSEAASTKGKVKKAVGWATGDRHVEAEGIVETETGSKARQEEVEKAEHDVRVMRGELRDDDAT